MRFNCGTARRVKMHNQNCRAGSSMPWLEREVSHVCFQIVNVKVQTTIKLPAIGTSFVVASWRKTLCKTCEVFPALWICWAAFFSACKPHGSGANFTSFFNFLISLLWIFSLHLKESWSAQGQLVARNCGLWHQISQIFRRLSLFRHLPPPKDANLALSSNWHTSSFSILYIEMEIKLIIEGPKLCKLCLCDEKT